MNKDVRGNNFPQPLRCLAISKDDGNLSVLQSLIKQLTTIECDLQIVETIKKAEKHLKARAVHLIFVEVEKINDKVSGSLSQLVHDYPELPVLVFGNQQDEAFELTMLQLGVQESFDINAMTPRGLLRVIRNAHERVKVRVAFEKEHQVLQDLASQLQLTGRAEKNGAKTHELADVNSQLIDQIKQQNIELQRLANFDVLTGLNNRAQFEKSLDTLLRHSKRHNHRFALLLVDLDSFKRINDTHGHPVGDAVLKNVAQRMQSRLRSSDIIARLGGDEFAVILPEIKRTHVAGIVAKKLLEALEIPFHFETHTIDTKASIGIACFPSSGDDAETLVKKADSALYHVKEHGRNNYQYASDELHEQHMQLMLIEEGLQSALRNDEFHLCYQPIVDLSTGKLSGMEALLRWEHPTLGSVSPEYFIPIAEESGMILPIGEWVLHEACEQYMRWQPKLNGDCSMAVNLSPRQLISGNLDKLVQQIINDTKIPNHCLELEVTEVAVMQDQHDPIAVLNDLNKMGVKSSMDDFGTGYSSLTRLKHLPIRTLKIDRSFINGIGTGSDDEVIIKSIIALANRLELDTVAEGIETQSQQDFLRSSQCNRGQGFLYSKPLSADNMMQYFSR